MSEFWYGFLLGVGSVVIFELLLGLCLAVYMWHKLTGSDRDEKDRWLRHPR